MEAHHPKDYTHGPERARVADRQRRDFEASRLKAWRLGYLSARCLIRYAQDRKVSGSPGMEELVQAAKCARDTARMLRQLDV